MPDNEKPIKTIDEQLADNIADSIRKLNEQLAEAGRKGMVIQVTMVTFDGMTVPSLRLESAWKRLDTPLIARL